MTNIISNGIPFEIKIGWRSKVFISQNLKYLIVYPTIMNIDTVLIDLYSIAAVLFFKRRYMGRVKSPIRIEPTIDKRIRDNCVIDRSHAISNGYDIAKSTLLWYINDRGINRKVTIQLNSLNE